MERAAPLVARVFSLDCSSLQKPEGSRLPDLKWPRIGGSRLNQPVGVGENRTFVQHLSAWLFGSGRPTLEATVIGNDW